MTNIRTEHHDGTENEPINTPILALAIAVTKQAIADVAINWRYRHVKDRLATRQRHADEAMTFLLEELNDPENLWGGILRHYGLRPLTRARVTKLARKGISEEMKVQLALRNKRFGRKAVY